MKSHLSLLKSWSPGPPPLPGKILNRKWRDIIGWAWQVGPMQFPVCQKMMRVLAFIDNPDVVESILRQMKLWCGPAAQAPARSPTGMAPESIEPDLWNEYKTMPDDENVITD